MSMSDDRLRELERRFATSGALEDEVALVQERLRTGVIVDRRLRLAAALGREAAGTLVREPPALDALVVRRRLPSEGEARWAWTTCADPPRAWRHGREALRRVGLAAARCALARWDVHELADDALALLPVVRDGRPEAAARAVTERTLERLQVGAGDRGALTALYELAHGLAGTRPLEAALAASVAAAMNAAGEAEVRAAVRDALAPWLLGHGDPLEAS
jgi:hypothetical protein